MIEKYLSRAVEWIEVLVAVILVFLTAFALFTLGTEIYHMLADGKLFTGDEFTRIMSGILEVFILAELFAIALAYMAHRNVIPTVLEAALVAVARKLVIFEPKGDYLRSSAGLALLLLAVAITWWFLAKARACEIHNEDHLHLGHAADGATETAAR